MFVCFLYITLHPLLFLLCYEASATDGEGEGPVSQTPTDPGQSVPVEVPYEGTFAAILGVKRSLVVERVAD